MKHLNLIGASLTAAMSLSVLIACDGRGVTAMKSRDYTPEEMATEKLRRQGQAHPTQRTDGASPTTSPSANPAPSPDKTDKTDRDPVVSDKEAGGARNKLFTEGKDGVTAAPKSYVLEIAKAELGKISKNAAELLKGVTVVDQGTPGKPRLAVDAILMPDDRALELHSEFDIDTTDKDVINGKSDISLGDLSANTESDPSRVTVATVCSESEKNVCQKVILIFSAAFGATSKDALVEVKLGSPGLVPNAELVTNAGVLKSFDEAQTELGSKMPPKADQSEPTKATIKPVVARPAAPFAADVKGKPVSAAEYKAYAAKYAEWKKAQTDAAQWAKHPRPITKPVAPTTQTVPPKPAVSAAPVSRLPTPDEAKTMTRAQIQAQISAYEGTLPVALPDEPKNELLKLAKVEVKPVDPKAEVEKALAQKRAEYEALPFYKKPFNIMAYWPEDKAAQIRGTKSN